MENLPLLDATPIHQNFHLFFYRRDLSYRQKSSPLSWCDTGKLLLQNSLKAWKHEQILFELSNREKTDDSGGNSQKIVANSCGFFLCSWSLFIYGDGVEKMIWWPEFPSLAINFYISQFMNKTQKNSWEIENSQINPVWAAVVIFSVKSAFLADESGHKSRCKILFPNIFATETWVTSIDK